MNGKTRGSMVGIQAPTTQISQSVDFYERVFGWRFQPNTRVEDIQEASTAFPFRLSPVHGPHRPGSTFINIEVDDVDRSFTAGLKLGSRTLIRPTATPFGIIAMIDDPSGAHLMLVARDE